MELTLPSNGERLKYRPFTVKEEKILLVAQESDEATSQILAAKQVVNNCLIDTDVADRAMFDLEYVILYIRARSVNNMINFSIRDEDTEERHDLEIDIDNLPDNFKLQINNGFPIKSYIDDMKDTHLIDLGKKKFIKW